MRLQGKTAVVTGAASGFGAEIARSYAREGANVVIADINEEWGKEVAQEIEGMNSGAAVFQFADVSRKEDVEGMVKAAVDRFGRVDILVNNAGYTHWNMPLDQVPEEEFDRIFAVNVKSIYHGMNAVLPHFREQEQAGPNRGVVLNIASTAGVRPRPGLVFASPRRRDSPGEPQQKGRARPAHHFLQGGAGRDDCAKAGRDDKDHDRKAESDPADMGQGAAKAEIGPGRGQHQVVRPRRPCRQQGEGEQSQKGLGRHARFLREPAIARAAPAVKSASLI